MLDGLANGVEQAFLSEIGDDRVVEIEERAIALLAGRDLGALLGMLHGDC
jgi:hypothetical protein